ncbi:MAG: hypothetical protein I8H71_00800 [Xanthomonadaceae bacterium]|nr:hypothetical protein [Xanthomonadaceae bacterium]
MSTFLRQQFVRTDDADRIRATEELRAAYRTRRCSELLSTGMCEIEAAFIVDEEIRRGDVLQAQPVTVVREGRSA